MFLDRAGNTDRYKGIKVIDCTFRDGGHLNKWNFDTRVVKDAYRAASNAGVDYFELGYIGSKQRLDSKEYGKWRFCDEKDIRAVVTGPKNVKLAAMVDAGKATLKEIRPRKDSLLDVIRVATYREHVDEAIELALGVKSMGYEPFLNLMAINSYTKEQIEALKKRIAASDIKNIYFSDSFGSFMPTNIGYIADSFLEMKGKEIGFHAHNNLQMAFANALIAIERGVKLIDATIFGMGRAAGNLPLEMLIAYLQEFDNQKYNVVPILEVISEHFVSLKNKLEWGYSLPYLISGFWACHPNYSKDIISMKEYTMEDVWNMMERISKDSRPSYSSKFLDDILACGMYSNSRKSDRSWIDAPGYKAGLDKSPFKRIKAKDVLDYADRHKGRDFLVLAGGPSLKEQKPLIDKLIKKDDPVILGANYLGGLFMPDYHAFTSRKRFIKYISEVDSSSKLLLSAHFEPDFIAYYTNRDYELIYHDTNQNGIFRIKDSVIETGYYTVSVLLILVANLMGAGRIFVAGMDGYKHTGGKRIHFYNETDETLSQDVEMQKHKLSSQLLKDIRRYLIGKGNEEFRIITPTTYSSHYSGIKNYI